MKLKKFPIIPILALSAVIAGCGGGGSSTSASAPATSTSTSTSATTTKTTTQKGQEQTTPKQGGGSQRPSGPAPTDPNPLPNQGTSAPAPGVPTSKGGDNSIQTYGTEAPAAERIAVAAAAKAFLDSEADGRWAVACTYLPSSTQRKMTRAAKRSPQIKGGGCAAVLGTMLARAPKPLLRSGSQIHVLSLRVKGSQAFVIYRNAAGKAYNLPLRREGGEWKVAALTGVALVL